MRDRLIELVRRASYPGWTWRIEEVGRTDHRLLVYRSDPKVPKNLQWLGPWPIPADAGYDEVEAVCLAAVVEVEGEAAGAKFSYRRD